MLCFVRRSGGGKTGKRERMPILVKYCMAKKTDELKKLIAEHPDYEIVVLAGENAWDECHIWTFCSDISFSIGEILDYDVVDDYEYVFDNRDNFQDFLIDRIADENPNASDEELEKLLNEKLKEFEPYWKKVIYIYANN